MSLESKRIVLIEYLLLKIDEEDWYGVSDTAIELRSLEVEYIKLNPDKKQAMSDNVNEIVESWEALEEK